MLGVPSLSARLPAQTFPVIMALRGHGVFGVFDVLVEFNCIMPQSIYIWTHSTRNTGRDRIF